MAACSAPRRPLIAVPHLERATEGAPYARGAVGELLRALDATQTEEDRTKRRHCHPSHASLLGRVQDHRRVACIFGNLCKMAEEHGFPIATRAEQHFSLSRPVRYMVSGRVAERSKGRPSANTVVEADARRGGLLRSRPRSAWLKNHNNVSTLVLVRSWLIRPRSQRGRHVQECWG